MSEKFYLEKLYPLQDKVLAILQQAEIAHYLSGGTVVGRFFLNHRYSDVLDFFLNNDPVFVRETEKAISSLNANFEELTIDVKDLEYFRVYVRDGDTRLKIDFINDVSHHYGEIKAHPQFFRMDNLENILSNKIAALGRIEAKDIIDIIYLSKAIAFTWPEVIEDAAKKDLWVNEVDIVNYLKQVSVERLLTKIVWVNKPDYALLKGEYDKLLYDIATGSANSLCPEELS